MEAGSPYSMDITFINHACCTIETNEHLVMFDPWFSGKVFNNSWALIKDTNINDLNLEKLKVIFITHEHPDHLHWPTLKLIKEAARQKIVVIIPQRKNKNVMSMIKDIGFAVLEIPQNREMSLFKDFSVANFPTGHDSAYVIKHGGRILLNQNDCKLSQQQCSLIKSLYPNIDYYLMQFSLAGFYANKKNKEKLLSAKTSHIEMIENYRQFFNPTTTIPFASFVYFCREENKFLNDYIVGLDELSEDYQLVSYMDKILLQDHRDRNLLNINKWNKNISNIVINKTPTVKKEDLLDSVTTFFRSNNYVSCPNTSTFVFYDIDGSMIVDYRNKHAFFSDKIEKPVAKVTSYDLQCFFKFPWGADTMNITSCFEVYDFVKWKQNLIFKDNTYKR